MELQEAYDSILEEGADGLDKTQAYFALIDIGHNPIPGLTINQYWEGNGKSDDDLIDCDEFKDLASNLGDPRKLLEEAFTVFDKDNSGTIDREELTQILKTTDVGRSGIALDEQFIDRTLAMGDTNGDGVLDINELIDMIVDKKKMSL